VKQVRLGRKAPLVLRVLPVPRALQALLVPLVPRGLLAKPVLLVLRDLPV